MTDYCAFVSNYLGGGVVGSKKPDGGLIRDKTEWDLSNYKVILKQREPIIIGPVSKLKNQSIDSSIIVIENVPKSKIKTAENISKDLACLLSFASLSQVRVYGSEYPMGSGNQSFHSTSGIAKFFRPPFDIRHGAKVKKFIDLCWTNYRKLKRKRKLHIVIEILTTAEAALLPLEIQLVSLFIALENLKDTFAKSKGIPYHKGFYRKVSSPPKSNLSKEPRYTFEELLTMMLREQGIRKGVRKIIKLRNDLIHSGISRISFKSQMAIYANCHEIIREYILKLLGYSGSYLSYERPNSLLKI